MSVYRLIKNWRILVHLLFIAGVISGTAQAQRSGLTRPQDSVWLKHRSMLDATRYDEIIGLYKKPFKKNACTNDEYKLYAAARFKKYLSLINTRRLLDRLLGDHYHQAKQSLERALKADTADLESKFLLGLMRKSREDDREAEKLLLEVIARDTGIDRYGFQDPIDELAGIYRKQERWNDLENLYEKALRENLTDGRARMEVAMARAEAGKTEDVFKLYADGLEQLNDSIYLCRLLDDIMVIACDNEKSARDSLRTLEAAKDYLFAFWKRRDDNPADDDNRLFCEFYKRLNYARTMYPKPVPPGYDDRGMIYIRLGKPDYIFVSPENRNTRENQTWIYEHIEDGMYFDFVYNYRYFELRPLIDAVKNNGALSELYRERAHIHPFYEQVAMRAEMKRYRNDWEIHAGSEIHAHIKALEQSRMQYFERLTGVPYLRLNHRLATFREKNNRMRLDYYFMIPYREMNFSPYLFDTARQATRLNYTFLLMNAEDQKTVFCRDTSVDIFTSREQIARQAFIEEIRYPVAPGSYRLVMQVTNNQKEKMQLVDKIIRVQERQGDSLMISDIQMAFEIYRTSDINRFTKPYTALTVIPNPSEKFIRSKPLMLYYEIYGLSLDNDGRSDFNVTYTVEESEKDATLFRTVRSWFSKKKDLSAVSLVTGKQGRERTEREYIGLDISGVPPGKALLKITVEDKISGSQAVSSAEIRLE